jgi:hypothetical protein
MTQAVHIPYTVEQDEDGVWCTTLSCVPAWPLTVKAIPAKLLWLTCARLFRWVRVPPRRSHWLP